MSTIISDGPPSSVFTLPNQSVVAPSEYNNWAFENILHHHFNQLRARLLNLAETSTRDRQQSDAMKGLIKDFCNEAFYPCRREIESFLRDKNVLSDGEDQCRGDSGRLNAQSLKDILYEPEQDAVR